MSEAYQEPSASSSPSGTQAGTSADESRGGSTTDTGPFPAMVWTRYGYRIDDDSFCQTNDIFCPCSADAVTHTPEDMRKYVSRLTGAPLESITVTLLSEYKANVKTSQWDASYHNGEKSQGRTRLSYESFADNVSVPNELVRQIQKEREVIERAKELEAKLIAAEGDPERLAEIYDEFEVTS